MVGMAKREKRTGREYPCKETPYGKKEKKKIKNKKISANEFYDRNSL